MRAQHDNFETKIFLKNDNKIASARIALRVNPFSPDGTLECRFENFFKF